jgi:hypothetical protein
LGNGPLEKTQSVKATSWPEKNSTQDQNYQNLMVNKKNLKVIIAFMYSNSSDWAKVVQTYHLKLLY